MERQEDEPQKVPEARLGDHFVGGKDAHAVDFGSRFRLCREMATDDLIFLNAHCYLLNQASDFLLHLASSTGNDVNPPRDCARSRKKGRCDVGNRDMNQYELENRDVPWYVADS